MHPLVSPDVKNAGETCAVEQRKSPAILKADGLNLLTVTKITTNFEERSDVMAAPKVLQVLDCCSGLCSS